MPKLFWSNFFGVFQTPPPPPPLDFFEVSLGVCILLVKVKGFSHFLTVRADHFPFFSFKPPCPLDWREPQVFPPPAFEGLRPFFFFFYYPFPPTCNRFCGVPDYFGWFWSYPFLVTFFSGMPRFCFLFTPPFSQDVPLRPPP